MHPVFSVVITTCQQPARLLKCLDALERQSLPRDQFEIIIIDDADSPTTATAVALFTRQLNQQHGVLEIRYLPQPIRQGAIAARNRGWQAARGHIVAFTDDDCLPHTDWLTRALPCFEDDTQFVAGGLRLQLPHSADTVSPKVLKFDPAELISANCFCVRETLERIGGFPETVEHVWQADTEFLLRLKQQSVPIRKCPDALVVHPIRERPGPVSWHSQQHYRYDVPADRPQPVPFWDRIGTERRSLPIHWAATSGAITGLTGLMTGGLLLATAGFGAWVMLATLFGRRPLPLMLQRPTFLRTVATLLLTPFVSVYWQLYSTFKYGVMYW